MRGKPGEERAHRAWPTGETMHDRDLRRGRDRLPTWERRDSHIYGVADVVAEAGVDYERRPGP